MSAEIVDISAKFAERGADVGSEEIDRIAVVQALHKPISAKKQIADKLSKDRNLRDPALLGLVEYHRELILGMVARSGIDFVAHKAISDTIKDIDPFIFNDNNEPQESFITVKRGDAGKGIWRHFGVITLSDINRHSLEIINGYKKANPKLRVTPAGATDNVLKAAFAQTTYELFANAINAGAFAANKYGSYKHGINLFSGYYEGEGLSTAIVEGRLRKYPRFDGSFEQEAKRFIYGLGHVGLMTEMTRNTLADGEMASDISQYISTRWRDSIPTGIALLDVEPTLVGRAYPYEERDIRETLNKFKAIEQPPLSENSFLTMIERAFSS